MDYTLAEEQVIDIISKSKKILDDVVDFLINNFNHYSWVGIYLVEGEDLVFIEAKVSMVPKNVVEVEDEKTAGQLMRLLETLEDNDDVQNVHANFDIPDEIIEKIS